MARRKVAQTDTAQETTVTNDTVNDTDFDTTVAPAAPEDLDVDAPAVETEDTVEPTADGGEKPAKEAKSTRPGVPEGFIAPVAFAKVLTDHLKANGQMPEGKTEIKPQEVYSYIKNNGEGSKNPFPAYAGDAINPETNEPYAPGRKVVLKADEGIAWWDAKVARVAANKAAAKEKAEKKATKSDSKAGETVEAVEEAPEVELTEAE